MARGLLPVATFALACLAALIGPLSAAGGASDGGLAPPPLAVVPISPNDADLSLSIVSNASVADPGDSVGYLASAVNQGNETATNVTLTVPLDPNATYISSVPTAAYDSTNRTLRWTVASIGAGGRVDVIWTIRVAVGTADNTEVVGRFHAAYSNATGAPLPPEEVTTTLRVQAPVFNPQLRSLPTRAERGDAVVAKLYVNNTGSGIALRAWSNWTLGGHFQFLYLEENVPVTNVSNGFRVTLSNLAPGPHALTAHLVVIRGLDDGLSMGMQTEWTATDGNGNRLVPSTTGDAVELLAPSFTVVTNASAPQVNTKSQFVVTVTLHNTGRAAGIGWLNTTLPGGVTFISDNGSFPRSSQSRRYSWTLPSMSPGNVLILGITLESAEDPRTVGFSFSLDYTDGKGTPPVSVLSPRVDVAFVAPPAGLPGLMDPSANPILWAALAAGAGGAGAFALWRRRRASDVQIEDVFVADMGGHLLAHRSSGLVAYEDEDILIGMFKVIQDFVKDSFAKGTDDTMKSMEFGERKIIIERGRYHFISVVYRGHDRGNLADRVLKVSRLVDHHFGQALENWSGDLDELRGLASLLPQVWKHRPRRAPVQPALPAGARTQGAPKGEDSAAGSGPLDSDGAEVSAGPSK